VQVEHFLAIHILRTQGGGRDYLISCDFAYGFVCRGRGSRENVRTQIKKIKCLIMPSTLRIYNSVLLP